MRWLFSWVPTRGWGRLTSLAATIGRSDCPRTKIIRRVGEGSQIDCSGERWGRWIWEHESVVAG